MRLDSRPNKAENVIVEEAAGTRLLLNLTSGEYFALNEVGSDVWELCDGKNSVADIVSVIANEYAAQRDVIEADVLELLGSLSDERLVVSAT